MHILGCLIVVWSTVTPLLLHDSYPAKLRVKRALHPDPRLKFQVQVVDNLLRDFLTRRDDRNSGRVRRDHFRANASGARFERYELRRGEKRLARREADGRHLRQVIRPCLDPAIEDARRRKDVERTILSRKLADAVDEPLRVFGRRSDREKRETIEQIRKLELNVVAPAQDLFGLIARIADVLDGNGDLRRVEIENARAS